MHTATLRMAGLFALVMILASASIAEAKSIKVQNVRGDLEAAVEDSEAVGRFRLRAITYGDKGNEKLSIKVRGLDAESDYEVFLGKDLENAVSFGDMAVRGKGGWGHFRFSSRRDDYPDDVDSLLEFSGQKIFVVDGDDTVLSGDIPTFAALDDEEVDDGAVTAGFGVEKLSPSDDDDSRAFGMISAGIANTGKGAYRWITVLAVRLDRDEEYDVVAVGEGDDDDVELGSLKFRGRWSPGYLGLSSAQEGGLPVSVVDLQGLTIEIRDADGNVVLTGTFPTL